VFADAARPLPFEDLDEDLERCMRRVSFSLHWYFPAIVLVLIGLSTGPHAISGLAGKKNG
jgi:hypothetical protein